MLNETSDIQMNIYDIVLKHFYELSGERGMYVYTLKENDLGIDRCCCFKSSLFFLL